MWWTTGFRGIPFYGKCTREMKNGHVMLKQTCTTGPPGPGNAGKARARIAAAQVESPEFGWSSGHRKQRHPEVHSRSGSKFRWIQLLKWFWMVSESWETDQSLCQIHSRGNAWIIEGHIKRVAGLQPQFWKIYHDVSAVSPLLILARRPPSRPLSEAMTSQS